MFFFKNAIPRKIQPKIKSKPPNGVTNQIVLAGTIEVLMIKSDPEKQTIPEINNILMVFRSCKVICLLVLITRSAKTWNIIYLTPVSKFFKSPGANLSSRACAPNAPKIIVIAPKKAVKAKICFMVIVSCEGVKIQFLRGDII